MIEYVMLQLRDLPRLWKRLIIMAFDFCALALALWASFSLRYGAWLPPSQLDQFAIILTAPLVAIPIFIRLGLYRAVIRYLPEKTLWTVFQGVTLATICWVLVVFLSEMAGRGVVPRSVPILYWALSLIIVGGSRFLIKRILWASPRGEIAGKPVIVYGAGSTGAQLANAMRRDPTRRIVAFVDDNRSLQGRDLAGLRVYSPASIGPLVSRYQVEEVILSIPKLPSVRRKEIVADVSRAGSKIRTIPPIGDLISGKYPVSQIREIDIDELLGRSSVPADQRLLRDMIEGKSIMVTGAGGSIGSELCRLIVELSPRRLVLFEANEFALYNIERELSSGGSCQVIPVLGSIIDDSNVRHTIGTNGIQVVFHAAAHKHVPLVEANIIEGIRNNVIGTQVVSGAAVDLGVASFVLISSDKAVRPTNVMGATKRWAELIVQQRAVEAQNAGSGQRFCAVRFGNVLGSNGSVVPLFKEQIAKGGPLTLTDPNMTRYFMSIHEASELIVQAGSLSKGGDVFLLEMGEPILISELAENMVRLAGMSVKSNGNPTGDIEIVVTGKRPGEKMYEELFYDGATAHSTSHPKIMRATGDLGAGSQIWSSIEQLSAYLAQRDDVAAKSLLFAVIDETASTASRAL